MMSKKLNPVVALCVFFSLVAPFVAAGPSIQGSSSYFERRSENRLLELEKRLAEQEEEEKKFVRRFPQAPGFSPPVIGLLILNPCHITKMKKLLGEVTPIERLLLREDFGGQPENEEFGEGLKAAFFGGAQSAKK